MKTTTQTKPVQHGGIVSEGQFRIKQSAKAFSILSSGLYSNKHEAILRELGCNAYDSHVEAGKGDVPFTVHLPTRLNPQFSVRDYGVGLDHDESTKTESNDFVGCMGLGSKSPFAYTDNFTVTAIKDGTKRHYTAFINAEGVPSIALLAEEETDECSGVEVAFAVNDRHDMYRFRDEAGNVYKWFKTKPEITGDEVDIPEIEYAERDVVPGVHIRKNERGYYHDRQSYAIMGNVAYPIKLENVGKDDDAAKRKTEIRKMFEEGGLVVEFEIGDLDIAASREELSYIPHTLDSIYARGQVILDKLGEFIGKELDGAKTKWERTAVLNRLHDSNRHLFAPAIEAYVKKNPRKFFKYTRINLYGAKTYFALEDFRAIHEDLQVSYYMVDKRYGDGAIVAHRNKHEHLQKDQDNSDSDLVAAYEIDRSTAVVMQDDKGGLLPRIKEGVTEGLIPNKNVLSFRITNKDVDKAAVYKKVQRLLGGATVIWSSTLPKTNTTHVSAKSLKVFQFYHTYGSYNSRDYKFKLKTDVTKLDKALKNKHVYLPLAHKSIDTGDGTMSPDTFYNFCVNNDVAKFLGIDLDNVYGINKTTRKLIAKDKGWVNFFDLLHDKFAKVDWAKAKDEALRKYIRNNIDNADYDFKLIDKKKLEDLKSNSPFGRLVTYYLDNGSVKADGKIAYDRLIIAMKNFTKDPVREAQMDKLLKKLKVNKADSELAKLKKEVEATYPMLKHLNLNTSWNKKDWNDAYDYIKLVDSVL
jgi:hypothetical protein